MRKHFIRALLPALLVVLSNPLHAESPSEASAWQWTLQGAAVHQFEADLDRGGSMSVDRFHTAIGAGRQLSDRMRIGFEFGYGEDRYEFAGTPGLGALAPWRRIREMRVSLAIRYFASREWTLFAIPSLRYQAERGASLSDGQTGGLLAGAIYRFTETLSIGPGLGVFSEIGDDTSVFPLLLIDWKLTDTLSLETGGGLAASRGPGLQLTWKPAAGWRLAFGARYEKTRFRLDDSGPAPGGVGQDKAVPLYASAEYSWSDAVKLSLIAGAEVGGNLRLEERDGRLVSDSDHETAPFLGLIFRARF